jgi:hypothetical protein
MSTFGVRTLGLCSEQLAFLHDDFIEALQWYEIDGEIVRRGRTGRARGSK